ncbi:HdeD family acid-resistance protein [Vagococcus vulneris]|uniref:DUF308 domain-containing protein n=1 Tax=Vagococcus vulneris TaxID=1977869 RepID=A0A429ZV34_9ENTE|nr:DUF308 domain-containing protein [Vagococcus vulneris]RST97604.1 hypothetical protein CBF37_09535 [Vagococcus vulneris]
MTSIFKTMQRYAIIRSIALIILGIITLVSPEKVFTILVYSIAIYNAVIGLTYLIGALRNNDDQSSFQMPIAFFYLIFALIVFLFSRQLLGIFTVFIGILFMIGGAGKISQAFNMKQYVNLPWVPMLVYGLVLAGIGLLIIFYPFRVLSTFLGIVLLIVGILELIEYFKFRNVSI